jgi:2-dehydropantoate 2-reductase
MRIAIIGAGGVGGYYGAMLAKAGADVSLVARGAHLAAIREDGLRVVGPLGDFSVHPRAERDSAAIGPVDAVILAVKTYDNATAFPLIPPLLGPASMVLTLQNGVDSAEDLAAAIGADPVVAGATYIAAAIEAPGVIRQTGTHRRIVFGECFNPRAEISGRVRGLAEVMRAADIQAEPVADARPPLWEKFIYLAPFAAVTGAARVPFGRIWADPDCREVFLRAIGEVEAVARAAGIPVAAGVSARIQQYASELPAATRSSLLIDLAQQKPIEVESLLGSVVRRARQFGVAVPTMAALYAVLKPHASGAAANA